MNSASILDFLFKRDAFDLEVRGVSVKDMCVLRIDVDMLEKMIPHERVVTLRVITRDSYMEYLKDDPIWMSGMDWRNMDQLYPVK